MLQNQNRLGRTNFTEVQYCTASCCISAYHPPPLRCPATLPSEWWKVKAWSYNTSYIMSSRNFKAGPVSLCMQQVTPFHQYNGRHVLMYNQSLWLIVFVVWILPLWHQLVGVVQAWGRWSGVAGKADTCSNWRWFSNSRWKRERRWCCDPEGTWSSSATTRRTPAGNDRWREGRCVELLVLIVTLYYRQCSMYVAKLNYYSEY